MTVLRVQHHHGDIVGDALIILLGIGVCNVARTADHIEHRRVKVLQIILRRTHHLHIADTRIQHHAGLDAGIVGHTQHLGTTARLPHRCHVVESEAMIVFRALGGILLRQPVEHLKQHLGISTELRDCRLLLLILLGVFGGQLSLLGLLFLTGLLLLGRQRQDLFTIGHNDITLGFRISRLQHAPPLCHHIRFVVRADGSSHITVGCHLAQQQAHLHIIIKAGTVGIDNHRQSTLLSHNLLQVLRTIHREARTGGIAHHFRLERTCTAFFHYLFLNCLGRCQPHTHSDHHRRHQ